MRQGRAVRPVAWREIAGLVGGAGLLAVGMAGCRSGGMPDADARGATTPEGIYDFSARVRGADVRGNFAISGNSIVFTAPDGSCQQPPQEATTRVVEYRTVVCGGTAGLRSLTFHISVLHPTRRSTWSAVYPVVSRRTVCEVKSVDKNGRDVCLRTGVEMFETTGHVSGPLDVRRAARAPGS